MATRNIVPRGDGEGSLGTNVKKWGAVHTDSLAVNENATGPTPSSGDNSTKLATTAFVQRELAGFTPSGSFLPLSGGTMTGDILWETGDRVARFDSNRRLVFPDGTTLWIENVE